jgi:hypothetical protein
MPSEEWWEKMYNNWLVREELEAEEQFLSDLSSPEPYTEEELEELYRSYKLS